MNELKTTILFGVTAAVLATAAMVIDPGAATPDVFSDQGEAFYPDFTDPQAPKAIEVVDYDEATATARPLKVEFAEGTWRVPSHFNYPADAEENWTRMPRIFEVASRLGASRVVAECANLSKARELEPLCQKFQIDLAIANQWPYPFGRPSDYSGLNGSVGSRIGAGPDTGWFAAGGQDPAELFDIAGDRIKVVHLKDVAAEGEYRPVDLGDGIARLAPFMAGLAEQGFNGPLTVARDPGKRITFDIGIFGDATYEVHEEAVADDEVMRSLRQARTWALEHGAVE